ncbi:MAG: PP2C family protein-serine/threonine phosphatase [Vulcanimicrobiaceae bacterium]
MEVAVSGDRGCVLSTRLGPSMYLFAVAHGFGSIDGASPARLALHRLRTDFERRARHNRLRRAQMRPKAITSALISALSRVNGDLHLRSASHEDYITAGCSLTAALIIDDRTYLAHVGTTAAYLARDGYVVGLTREDVFEADGPRILTRAIGIGAHLEVAVCSFTLSTGDALVLSGRRIRVIDERRRLTEQLLIGPSHEGKDDLLIVRYEESENEAAVSQRRPRLWLAILNGALAAAAFYATLCLR